MKAWYAVPTALAVALLALTGCARERSGDVHPGPGGLDAIEVVMHDDAFAPGTLSLETGATVTIEVTNRGDGRHNFTIDALDLSTGTVEPGAIMTATLDVPSGVTDFHCTFHPGMGGEIVAV